MPYFACELETDAGHRFPVSIALTERRGQRSQSVWDVDPGMVAFEGYAFTASIPENAKPVAIHGRSEGLESVSFRLDLRGVNTTVPQGWIKGKWPGT
jgi:hypothetical protein